MDPAEPGPTQAGPPPGTGWLRRLMPAAIIAGFAALGGLAALATLDRMAPPVLSRAMDRSVVVTDRDGAMLRPFLASDGIWRFPVSPDAVDPLFLRLLVAYEDQRFAGHLGVDPLAGARAAWQLLANLRVVSGASTLTMQVARLLEPRPRTLGSKIIEAARALQLEAHFTKDEILGLYLTLAPYGGNLEGVRAASLAYFGKEPLRLTLAEAALLVALPQSPERQRPDRNPAAARAGRDKVLLRLVERGVITPAAAAEAMAAPVPERRLAYPFLAPHLAQRLAGVAAPGEVVVSTLDRDLQARLESFARAERAVQPDGADIALVVVDNDTRRIVAYLGSSDFWAPFGQVDLARAERSPGSALKPFIYGLAFDDLAIHPLTLIDDKPTLFGTYAPRNFDRGYQGTITVQEALQHSLNVPAVALLDRVGPVKFAALLRMAGARLSFPRSWTAPSLPMALGGVGLSLTDLTMLYAAIPNDGLARPLRVTIAAPEHDGVRLFGPTAAWYLREVLAGVPLPDGWAMGRGIERTRRIAFKTGTSFGYRDAWTVGFSARYTVGVWVGRADGSTRPGRFGRNEAAPLMLRVFDLLPQEPRIYARPPADVLVVQRTNELPRAMQRFLSRPDTIMAHDARTPQAPQIMFPPDGARVPLPAAHEDPTILLRAEGGRAPLRWIVNGEVLPDAPRYADTFFEPDGLGFTRITVVDADGRSATSQVRFVRD